jgi:hypothetical protein
MMADLAGKRIVSSEEARDRPQGGTDCHNGRFGAGHDPGRRGPMESLPGRSTVADSGAFALK